MSFTTREYRCTHTVDHRLADASGLPGEDDGASTNPGGAGLTFGDTSKPSMRSWAYLRFGERNTRTTASGLGIPPSAIIDSVSVSLTPNVTSTGTFNAEFSLLVPDGNWDALGEPRYRPLVYPGKTTTSDFLFVVSGNGDSSKLFETTSASTLDNMQMFGGIEDQPTMIGEPFALAGGVTGTISNVGVRKNRSQNASPDFNIWVEISTSPDALNPGELLAISDKLSFNGLPGPGLTGYTYFPFTGENQITISGGGFYHWALIGDKTNTALPGRMQVGWQTNNPWALGTPGVSGSTEGGFSADIYPLSNLLPSPFENDNTTVNVAPFGSIVSQGIPAVVSGTQITISGLETLVQEWVDDDDYDREKPMCLVIGPGEAGEEITKSVFGTKSTESATDPRLTVTYRKRRVVVT